MDITIFSDANDKQNWLNDFQESVIRYESLIFTILNLATLSGAVYVSAIYLYELKIKKPLIITYYILVMIAASLKLITYAWCVIYPIQSYNQHFLEEVTIWSVLYRF